MICFHCFAGVPAADGVPAAVDPAVADVLAVAGVPGYPVVVCVPSMC